MNIIEKLKDNPDIQATMYTKYTVFIKCGVSSTLFTCIHGIGYPDICEFCKEEEREKQNASKVS